MTVKMTSICLSVALCAGAAAQSAPNGSVKFMEHASVVQSPGRGLVVTASSPRPVLQALTALRRKYGWILDYEETRLSTDQLTVDADGVSRPRGASFQVAVPAPKSVGFADESTFLSSFISTVAVSASGKIVLKTSSPNRQTVLVQNSSEQPMLDTPIRLNRETRTIDDAVEEILKLVSDKRGTPLVQGGLVDPGLLRTNITIGGDVEVPARNLLVQALDAAEIARVWSLGYEPSDGNFVIAIEPAVRAETDITGKEKIAPIWNPANSK